jgi:excisionase family DNA binding protein
MEKLQEKLDSLLDYSRAAELLNVSVPTVKRLVGRGELQAVRVGQRALRFEPATLQTFIENRRLDGQKAERRGA